MNKRAKTLVFFLAVSALAGCRQAGDDLVTALFPGAETYMPGLADLDEEERRRRVIAWLQSDLDGDGLLNEIELEFGLDPEDPSDGPDIDGDGIPNYRDDDVDGDGIVNQTDPDIDGDGLFNFLDADIDGDAVPNSIDFDIDADGIRRIWDWDTDGDGEDDDGGDDDDEEDEDDARLLEEALEKYDKLMRDAGLIDTDDTDEEPDNGPRDDDEEPSSDPQAETITISPQVDDPVLNRFAANVEQNRRRAEEGDESAEEELKKLARTIDSGDPRPIRIGGEETYRIELALTRRFLSNAITADEFHDYLLRLDELSDTGDEDDDSDALDALYQQVMDIQDPRSGDADEELEERIDGIEEISEQLDDESLLEISDGVNRLVNLPGDETLEEKVDGVINLSEAIDNPDLDNMMDALEQIMQEMEGLEAELSDVIEAAKDLPGISDGIDEEEVEEVVEALAE